MNEIEKIKTPPSRFETIISSPILLIILPATILGMMLIQSCSSIQPKDVRSEVLKNREQVMALKAEVNQLKEELKLRTLDRIYRSQFEQWRKTFERENTDVEVPELPIIKDN